MIDKELEARFWKFVQVKRPEQCWLWTGADRNGYGHIRKTRERKVIVATHVSVMLRDGLTKLPEGMIVCHTCDNPLCVNPHHLFLGTHKDNSDDKIAKGRHRTGDQVGHKNGNAELSQEDVNTIVTMIKQGLTNVRIAGIFGVTHQMISRIRLGKSWTHLTGGPITERYSSLT